MSDPSLFPSEDGAEQPRDVMAVASAVDEKTRKKRENKKVRKEREDREFFAQTVQSEIGRRFLWSILNDSHAFETIFAVSGAAGYPNPEATWMHFGEQQLGQRLYHTWHLRDPENVMKMLVENCPKYQRADV